MYIKHNNLNKCLYQKLKKIEARFHLILRNFFSEWKKYKIYKLFILTCSQRGLHAWIFSRRTRVISQGIQSNVSGYYTYGTLLSTICPTPRDPLASRTTGH